jgi:small-conductance mechanosensitive channel
MFSQYFATHIFQTALLIAVVVTALLVNRFAPTKRARLRRVVLLTLFHFAATGLAWLVGGSAWAARFGVAADLFGAFAAINVTALIGFDVVLKRLGVELVSITTDLAVGVSYIVTTIAILRGAGLNPTEAIATGAVVSAVLALSLQSTLGNILGGVALQLDGSIQVGDWIQLENGRQGRVARIRWRHTVLETRDWSSIIVPNATLLGSNIMVLGQRDGRKVPHRMWVHFHVDHRFSPARVIDVVTEALRAAPIDRVADEPPPNCICLDLAHERRTSFALYAVRYHLTDLAHDDPTSSAVRVRIHSALRRAGIPLAMPATAVFLSEDDEEKAARREARQFAERVEALRAVELFAELSDEEVHALAPALLHAPFSQGEVMTRQGATAHYLYIMTSGKGEVRTTVGTETKTVTTLHAPAFFGEMGLMTGETRMASVVALSEVNCYRLDKAAFEGVLQRRPAIAEELSRILAHRRVELIGIREGLSHEQRAGQEDRERERILERIKDFFALS